MPYYHNPNPPHREESLNQSDYPTRKIHNIYSIAKLIRNHVLQRPCHGLMNQTLVGMFIPKTLRNHIPPVGIGMTNLKIKIISNRLLTFKTSTTHRYSPKGTTNLSTKNLKIYNLCLLPKPLRDISFDVILL